MPYVRRKRYANVVEHLDQNGFVMRQVTMHDNGNPKMDVSMCNGLPHGELQEYYPDGKRKRVEQFEKGLLNGRASSFYPTGGLHKITEYSLGKANGDHVVFTEDGRVKKYQEYKDGKPCMSEKQGEESVLIVVLKNNRDQVTGYSKQPQQPAPVAPVEAMAIF